MSSSNRSKAAKATAAEKVGAPDPKDEQPVTTGDKQVAERPVGEKFVDPNAQGASIVDSAPANPSDDEGKAQREVEAEQRGDLDLAAEARKAQERGPLADEQPGAPASLLENAADNLDDPRLDRTAEQGTAAEGQNIGAELDAMGPLEAAAAVQSRVLHPDAVGIRPDAAVVDPPVKAVAAPPVDSPDAAVASTALGYATQSANTPIVDAKTGEAPELDGLFIEQGPSRVLTRRLIEHVTFGPHSSPSTRLIAAAGATFSPAQADALSKRIAQANQG